MNTLDRFVNNTICLDEEQGGCWRWLGSLTQGYGHFHVRPRHIRAHRWSYEHFVEPIPTGLEIDHLCRNTWCVNPDHLEAVTKSENQRRSNSPSGINARKTHCPHSHEYTAENTYVNRRNQRTCRECHRRKERIRIREKRARIAALGAPQ